jgi:uncharacterized protein with PQ loop repeat
MLDTLGFSDIAGFVALVITVAYTCLGLPVQIRKNYSSKSTRGLSLFTVILMLATFTSWLVYGIVKAQQDWYLVGSNLPGAACTVVLVSQFWLYRRIKPDK